MECHPGINWIVQSICFRKRDRILSWHSCRQQLMMLFSSRRIRCPLWGRDFG
ncbi:hypothetical protein BXO447_023310 (plasmid) [Xanthomonas oryzae pv. oryzae]|nr:hypothetical protein BXO447_023310 [Xanthomonas oryzae pv. oryzae]